MTGERTHVGLYTELGILYAKYRPERLMDFIRQYSLKMNIPKSVRECQRLCLWREAVVLHIAYDEFDHAASKMILHCTTAWSHDQFVRVRRISKIVVVRILTAFVVIVLVSPGIPFHLLSHHLFFVGMVIS